MAPFSPTLLIHKMQQIPQFYALVRPYSMVNRLTLCIVFFAQLCYHVDIFCRKIICVIDNPDVLKHNAVILNVLTSFHQQIHRIVANALYL